MGAARWLIALLALAGSAGIARAQQQGSVRLQIDQVATRIGFPNAAPSSEFRDCFKAGLWAPLRVKFVEQERGNILLPLAVDGSISGELLVETADNDNVSTIYPQKFSFAANEPRELVTYVKLSGIRPELKLTVRSQGKSFETTLESSSGIPVGYHLYVVLGDHLPDFHEALVRLAAAPKEEGVKETRPRYLGSEGDILNLPTEWFGYEGVDLALITGINAKLIDKLVLNQQTSPQLNALADWVRRGGRLVVSVAPDTREKVYQLLTSPAWRPALPSVLSQDSKAFAMKSLDGIRNWANALQEPFRPKLKPDGQPTERLAVKLDAPLSVSVDCLEKDGAVDVPVVVRFPYGRGNITVLGFDVKDPFINEWAGRYLFWQQVVKKLAPASTGQVGAPGWQNDNFNQNNMDRTTRLHQALEQFDTPRISFAWVAIFIALYILVVGPLDYLVLKLVFKRLEWTWITFPAVVLTVSALAYFTAYAIKGQELKVNKIDLIDIDLRSNLNDSLQPAGARIYGTTWFAILSPRIQNYTIGIEPMMHLWESGPTVPSAPIEPTMSWLGRPENSGMGSSGRGRTPSLFSRTYNFEPRAVGLRDVPIPVWTTRGFTASWESGWRGKLPLTSTLTYEPGKFQSVAGTITNNLPVELTDVSLLFQGKFYPLADLKPGDKANIVLDPQREIDISTWANSPQAFAGRGGSQRFLSEHMVRGMMFHEKLDPAMTFRNHAQRNLDYSWRIQNDSRDGRVREMILVANLTRISGQLDPSQAPDDPRLPTQLWLGEIPGTPIPGETTSVKRADGKMETVPVYRPRPSMQGDLFQETVIRVVMPVAPKQ